MGPFHPVMGTLLPQHSGKSVTVKWCHEFAVNFAIFCIVGRHFCTFWPWSCLALMIMITSVFTVSSWRSPCKNSPTVSSWRSPCKNSPTVSSWRSPCKNSPSSSYEHRAVRSGYWPSDQANRLGLLLFTLTIVGRDVPDSKFYYPAGTG